MAILRRPPEPSAITKADRARDAGDWDAAARNYRAALERNPARAPIWIQYAHALKELGHPDYAEIAYREATLCQPELADGHLQLGHLLRDCGKPDEAKAAYTRALALDSGLTVAQDELSRLGSDMPDAEELRSALADLKRRVATKPPNSSRISRADAALGRTLWGLAARLYAEALARNPGNLAIWIQYGHALKGDGKLAKAEEAYRRAIAADPAVADWHLQLGHVLKLQGNREEAQRSYVTALALDPALGEVIGGLAELGWSGAQLDYLSSVTDPTFTPNADADNTRMTFP